MRSRDKKRYLIMLSFNIYYTLSENDRKKEGWDETEDRFSRVCRSALRRRRFCRNRRRGYSHQEQGGEVLFRHGIHVDDAGIACQACHPDPYLSAKQHKKATMKEMQKGKIVRRLSRREESLQREGQLFEVP